MQTLKHNFRGLTKYISSFSFCFWYISSFHFHLKHLFSYIIILLSYFVLYKTILWNFFEIQGKNLVYLLLIGAWIKKLLQAFFVVDVMMCPMNMIIFFCSNNKKIGLKYTTVKEFFVNFIIPDKIHCVTFIFTFFMLHHNIFSCYQ